jgi:hypothetical protein
MLRWYCIVCLTEHMPGAPPQSLSQAPQARVQRTGPPEGTPQPYQAYPYEAWWSTPPPPPPHGVQVPWGQPQHLVSHAGPASGSSVAPGAIGPSGSAPPLSQAQSSSPAPSGKIKEIEGELKHFFLPNVSTSGCVITIIYVFRTLHSQTF